MGEVKLPSAEEVVEQIYLAIDARDGRCLNEAVGKLYQYRDALLEAAAEVADKLLDDARNPWEISREILALKEKP